MDFVIRVEDRGIVLACTFPREALFTTFSRIHNHTRTTDAQLTSPHATTVVPQVCTR